MAREGAAAKRGFVAAARAAGPGRPGARGRPAPGARGPAGRPARQSRPGRRARASAQLPGTRGPRAAAAGRRLRPGAPRPAGESGRSWSARRGGGWSGGLSGRAAAPSSPQADGRPRAPRCPGNPACPPAYKAPARGPHRRAGAPGRRGCSGLGAPEALEEKSSRARGAAVLTSPLCAWNCARRFSVLVSIETPASGPDLMDNGLGPSFP